MTRATVGLTALLAVGALVLGVGGAASRSLADAVVIIQVIGQGNVSDSASQISCGSGLKCYATYTPGGQITLTETPGSSDWTFSGWTGCSGTGNTCTLSLTAGFHEVTASYSNSSAGTNRLNVNVSTDDQGEFHGNVSAALNTDYEISCGSNEDDECFDDFPTGSTLTVWVDDVDDGWAFGSWSGSCDTSRGGTQAYCTFHLTADHTIGANFTQSTNTAKLTVTVTGRGTVTGTGGIACTATGGTCSATLDKTTSVTLEAVPSSGERFITWGGTCAGTTPTCTFQLTADKTVTAQFSGGGATMVPLTVSVSGDGSVTGSGIDCGDGGTTCTANLAVGATATLTAEPASGASFQSWGGACSGSGTTCTVKMDAAKTVTATFTSENPSGVKRTLSLHVAGAGTVSAPGGACASVGPPKTCTQTYADGASLTLTAVPANGHKFIKWSGVCSGSSTTCAVTMNAPKSVTATFSGAPPPKAGPKTSQAILRSLGRPAVHQTATGYEVTLRFSSRMRGTAHVRAIRAGRLVTGLSFPIAVGIATVGPFPVTKPGFYQFDLDVANHSLRWPTCLGRCGKAAPAPPLVLQRELPRVAHGGAVWSISLRFKTTLPIGARLRIYRGGKLVKDYRFAPEAGMVTTKPLILSPGTYTLRLNALDGFGRVGSLTWYALLP
jgi:hypothetical protein